ncbi:Tim44/TimA family putative adaptor protein [Lentibacter sp. XHP0401]|jgi:predicted lipid-binding transport protein (Tim44 family)|uniref:Tim44/TimA family putative adaptor protein n=1 Tax=Lentibacter sp. XHP0401 TaxID=2984334 RepID=UPI0021E904C5|nr:Tim44/TimA family putative adaptor protein [Lentibacter sp. XHP0401]MCV2892605.1 Tim44/TimA family putative adaptor protein [Lentibacter sp. XHP0401]
MNSPILQLLVLAGIAIFLILRLRSVLGTRDGYEAPEVPPAGLDQRKRKFEVIEGGPDEDITDHAEEGSDTAKALAKMKQREASFSVGTFLSGARGAYEFILMGFERGELAEIKPYLADEVYDVFAQVVEAREKKGLKVEADFIGVREMTIHSAEFHEASGTAEISVKFVGELTSVVRDNAGEIVEGKEGKVKTQKDIWTFEREMGVNDPNWILVATGE